MKIVNQKLLAFCCLLAGIFLLAGWQQKEEHKPQNLKVLPKNISHEDLDKIMDGFKVALGVKCNFCHVQSKTDPKRLDFASDENHHKDIARDMIKMTQRINKKYFKNEKGQLSNQVSCMTCHNGSKEPKN